MKYFFFRHHIFTAIFVVVIGYRFCCAQTTVSAGLKIEGQVAFTEGPAYHKATDSVYFTDIENNRIMRRDSKGKIQVFRSPSGKANGLVFDQKGRLHACEGGNEGGNRRITRTEIDGSITVLTERFDGKRYNSPNDLTIDSKSRIYFTDPRYGDRSDMEIKDGQGKAIEGVYRIDPDGKVSMIITHEVDRPNGIAISNDEKYLFVADNNNAQGQNRKLWRFDLKPDGTVDKGSQKELFDWANDRGPDGMDIGKNGDLYVTAGFNFSTPPPEKFKAGIYVISPKGEEGLKRFIPIPADMVTNCTFGGAERNTLFITAGHFLWSVPITQ